MGSRLYLLFGLALSLVVGAPGFAQSGGNTSWSESSAQRDPSGAKNSIRARETHSEKNGRTIDKQSLERLGPDGRYQAYRDTETETVKVDANTTRTIVRTFGRDPDGRPVMTQQSETESHSLPGGAQKTTRTQSAPDVNGKMQVVQREVQDAKPISTTVRETKTTTFVPDVNGGLVPATRVQERETKTGEHSSQIRKSTFVPDGNGNWQLSEVRDTNQQDGKDGKTSDQRVSRPGTDGKLAVDERTVSKSNDTGGTVETYSTEIPGSSPDGKLHLVQREKTVLSKSGRSSRSETQVQQANPANPSDGMRVTEKTIDIVRPGTGGTTQETRTTLAPSSTGSLGAVWVDTGKSDKPVEVDTKAKAGDSKTKAVDTKSKPAEAKSKPQ